LVDTPVGSLDCYGSDLAARYSLDFTLGLDERMMAGCKSWRSEGFINLGLKQTGTPGKPSLRMVSRPAGWPSLHAGSHLTYALLKHCPNVVQNFIAFPSAGKPERTITF
jgi:hypothetical protein